MNERTNDWILYAIEDVLYSGSRGNFAIFEIGEAYYIQIAASRGDYEIFCEAVSNYYLEEHEYLSEEQEKMLLHIGWQRPASSNENFHLTHKVDSEKLREELFKLIIATADLVYKRPLIREEGLILELNSK